MQQRLCLAVLLVVPLFVVHFAGCSACTTSVPCSGNSDCAAGDVCAASAEGSFCVPEASEGEGEGEGEPNPVALLRLDAGALEGDERIDVTLGWTLTDVTGCALEADGVGTQVDLSGQNSTSYVVEASLTLQIVCNETTSAQLVFLVHDVSDIEGPIAAVQGATVAFTFTVEGVTVCAVMTDGVGANLTQPVIVDGAGSFTDVADADKSYALTCAGSEGAITRTFDLLVLVVAVVTPPAAIITWGQDVTLTISVKPEASCTLVSTAEGGSDRRSEGGAIVEVDGEERTFTIIAPVQGRAYSVECSIGDVSVASTPAVVHIRPRILSFDARIPGIETLSGAAATLELSMVVAGLEAGGSCLVNDGTADVSNAGANVVLTTGPSVAVYTLRCAAPGIDPTPSSAGGFQVIWRDTTEADLALLAASRFAMGSNIINNTTVDSIDLASLEQTGGSLQVGPVTAASGAFSFSAANLTDVAGGLSLDDSAIASLSLPLLRSAGYVEIGTVDALSAFDAPALAYINDGSLFIHDCANLLTIDVPALGGNGNLFITDNAALQRVSAPVWLVAGGVTLSYNPALTTTELPLLRTITGFLQLENVVQQTLALPALESIGGDLGVASSPGLRTLSLPVLTAIDGDVFIGSNSALQYLDTFVLLDTDPAGNFTVTNNPQLSCAEISDVYCPLLTRDITPTISNNQSATCPSVNSGC